MGTVAVSRPDTLTGKERSSPELDYGLELLSAIPQAALGLLPRTCHRLLLWLIGRRAEESRGARLLGRSAAACALGFVLFYVLFVVCVGSASPSGRTQSEVDSTSRRLADHPGEFRLGERGPAHPTCSSPTRWLAYLSGLFVQPLTGALGVRHVCCGACSAAAGDRSPHGFSSARVGLLPLASLLMLLPIIMPEEAVLSETVAPARNGWHRFCGVFAFVGGLTACSPCSRSARSSSPDRIPEHTLRRNSTTNHRLTIADRLPNALIEGWPFVLLIMYGTDFCCSPLAKCHCNTTPATCVSAGSPRR